MLTGKQIRAARVMVDWDADDLAKRVGLSRTAIQNIERGENRPRNSATYDRITDAFYEVGVEFTENEGVRRRPEGIQVMKGGQGFLDFYDTVYSTLQKQGGDVCIGGSDSSLYTKYRPNPEAHRRRMAELVRQHSDIRVRILVKEGDLDFVASEYATYRWQDKENFSPTTFYTFGDYLGLINFYHRPAPHIILIKSKAYADSYKSAFELLWKSAREPVDAV